MKKLFLIIWGVVILVSSSFSQYLTISEFPDKFNYEEDFGVMYINFYEGASSFEDVRVFPIGEAITQMGVAPEGDVTIQPKPEASLLVVKVAEGGATEFEKGALSIRFTDSNYKVFVVSIPYKELVPGPKKFYVKDSVLMENAIAYRDALKLKNGYYESLDGEGYYIEDSYCEVYDVGFSDPLTGKCRQEKGILYITIETEGLDDMSYRATIGGEDIFVIGKTVFVYNRRFY